MVQPEVFDGVATGVQTQRRRWPATAVSVCTWLYIGAVLTLWLLLRLAGDRWWFATVIMFGPRWLCAVPLAVLVPVAGLFQRRLLWVLGAAAIMVFGPVMGFCIPWARLAATNVSSLRVLTCNLKGKCTDNDALKKLIEETMPDIVALQCCWGDVRIDWPAGWHVCQVADLIVASRYPVHQAADHRWLLTGHSPQIDMLRCTVQAAGRDIDFCSVHLNSPHQGLASVLNRRTLLRPSGSLTLDAEIDQRWLESEDAHHWASNFASSMILAGDFNMPVDSAIYRRYWADLRNAFSDAGLGFGYTEWPWIRGQFFGVRIDHVLTGPGWRCRRCWVGLDVGSDHLPVIADLVWQGGTPFSPAVQPPAEIAPTTPSAIPEKQPSAGPKPLTNDRLRTWTSDNGYHIEAEFLSVVDEMVKLRKADGTRVSVPLARLSTEDKEFIRRATEN